MKYKLILEGPDGAGKSTLAKSIGKTWHHGYYEDAKEMFCEVAKSILSECQVIDRCHYSEIVYSGIHRNEKQRLGSKVRMLDRLILSKKYIVVKCLPDYEICYKAWSSGREEMVKDEVKFKKIYQSYSNLEINTPHVVYDWTKDSIKTLEVKISNLNLYDNKGPGIGNFKPGNILLVGDKTNDKDFGGIDIPFVSWSGCSPWLSDQLDKSSISESELYFVNCITTSNELTSANFIDILKPRLVIALGEHAAKWCELNKVQHERISHPQYWKRFNSKKIYPLIDILKKAIA